MTARILVIDDEAGIRGFVRRVLEGEGHSVTEASDGKQALRMLEENEYDLVIADIVMPGRDGLEVIMHLHRTLPAVKVIAISGGNHYMLESAVAFGAVRSLEKPFSGADLLRLVEEALSQ